MSSLVYINTAGQLVGRCSSEIVVGGPACYVDAMNWLQMALDCVDRNDEGIAILEQMLVIDSLNVIARFNYSWYLGWSGRVEEAHKLADQLVALQQELNVILVEEHAKVLQLICFNNPTPDNWQPLLETCEVVEEKRRL